MAQEHSSSLIFSLSLDLIMSALQFANFSMSFWQFQVLCISMQANLPVPLSKDARIWVGGANWVIKYLNNSESSPVNRVPLSIHAARSFPSTKILRIFSTLNLQY